MLAYQNGVARYCGAEAVDYLDDNEYEIALWFKVGFVDFVQISGVASHISSLKLHLHPDLQRTHHLRLRSLSSPEGSAWRKSALTSSSMCIMLSVLREWNSQRVKYLEPPSGQYYYRSLHTEPLGHLPAQLPTQGCHWSRAGH